MPATEPDAQTLKIDTSALIERLRTLIPQHFLPGLSVAQIDAVERHFGVTLPDDLRLFYSKTNGTWDATDPEHGWTTFWSVDRWELAEGEHLLRAVLIADHCLSSWWYAQELAPGDGYGAIHLVGSRDGVPVRVAGSFSELLKMVLDDDPRIYPPTD